MPPANGDRAQAQSVLHAEQDARLRHQAVNRSGGRLAEPAHVNLARFTIVCALQNRRNRSLAINGKPRPGWPQYTACTSMI
jgi:hypothetical protein